MKQRHGFTLIEICAAAAMLAALLLISTQMLHAFSNHQQAIKQRAIALQAIQAVSELAGDIPWNQLTAETARQIKIPPQLERYLPATTLIIVVEDEPAPAASKRIIVELSWNGSNERAVAPVRLTTWAFPPPIEKN